MAYSEEWNTAYEARPVHTVHDINKGDDEVMNLRINTRETFQTLRWDMDAALKTISSAVLRNPVRTVALYGPLSGAAQIDCSLGDVHRLTMSGNVTLSIVNAPACGVVLLDTIQDATGGRMITFPAACRFPGGVVWQSHPGVGSTTRYALLTWQSGARWLVVPRGYFKAGV
ncbi:MAG TPA: hypothetical protein PLE60_13675 [Candidatus Latescibacteria bacterium]|nr:hypothetical protein [Spirochaetota bacterium]HPU86372.1 hypothetical protein [Candidatus Latescibacterota bacterium]